uniref:Uncharacterized protein n=1 Tax=Anguilla anguilla TaxID=7936 RepID=A0A0E9TNF0_ANGAN
MMISLARVHLLFNRKKYVHHLCCQTHHYHCNFKIIRTYISRSSANLAHQYK